jgi:hypothetical protein
MRIRAGSNFETMNSPNLPQRSPFRSLGQNASGIGQILVGRRSNNDMRDTKPFEVNVMVENTHHSVKQKDPSSTEEEAVRVEGSNLIRSPTISFEGIPYGTSGSPMRRPLADSDEEEGMGRMLVLHESEISIFQQLCLDRQDDNGAIEIMLDSTTERSPTVPSGQDASINTESDSSDIPSEELKKDSPTVVGVRVVTEEYDRRRKFFDRFFFKSSRKVVSPQSGTDAVFTVSDVMADSSHEGNTLPLSSIFDTSNDHDDILDGIKVSALLESNISFVNPVHQNMDNQQRCSQPPKVHPRSHRRGDMSFSKGEVRLDTFSHVSSFSGTPASNLRTPLTFDRHESLGVESIMDIRKCLMEMERELGQATRRGQKVSRRKVIMALCTVADSIEEDAEHGISITELETVKKAAMKDEEWSQPVAISPIRVASDNGKSMTTTSYDHDDNDEDFTNDGAGFDDEEFSEESFACAPPFNRKNSVGNIFGVNPKHRQAVEAVLDDLLWTEFVSSRYEKKYYGNHKGKTSTERSQRQIAESNNRQKVTMQVKDSKVPPRKAHDHEVNDLNRNASFWRRKHPSTNTAKLAISPVRDDHECNMDKSASASSEEVPSYLPSSITLKHAKRQCSEAKCSSSESHYRVNLIDTESRLGFEMDTVSQN